MKVSKQSLRKEKADTSTEASRKILEENFPCNNRGLTFILLQAAKFPLNPTVRGLTDGPHFQLSGSDTELHRMNEHTYELI
jgi:hypothetical protein